MLVSTRQTSGIPRALLTMAGQTLLETQDSATLPSSRHSTRRLSPIRSTSTATPGEASSRVRHIQQFRLLTHEEYPYRRKAPYAIPSGVLQRIQHSKLWPTRDN